MSFEGNEQENQNTEAPVESAEEVQAEGEAELSPELVAALDEARAADKPETQQAAWGKALALAPTYPEAVFGYAEAVKAQYEPLRAGRPKTDAQIVGLLTKALDAAPYAFELYDLLAGQYEAMNRRSEWVGTLQKKATVLRGLVFTEQGEYLPTATEDDRVALFGLYLQIAKIFLEKFQNQAEATKAYEAALEVDAGNREAIEFLKQMYDKRRDWERLIAVTRREIDLDEDVYIKAQKTLDLAKMAAEKLRKPPINIELWRAVLELDPENETALVNLEQLYEREKTWDMLAWVCERQVEISQDNARRSALYQKLGLLYGDKLNDAAKAVEAWRGLLMLEPDNKRALDSLKKKYIELHDWESLEELYAQEGKWDEFIRLLERTVDTVEPEAKISILFTVARLYATKVNQIPKARKAYERIFEFDAQNRGAAQALIPIYEEAKDWKALVQAKEIDLSHTTEQPDRVALLLEIAQLQEENIKDKASAFDTYRRVFEEEWTRDDIRAHFERLAGEVDGWAILVASYEAAFAKYPTPLDAVPVMLEVGRANRDHLNKIDASIAIYNQVLELDPNNPNALDSLELLYEGTERWEHLLAIRQKKAELVDEGEERCELRFKIAQLLEEKLGRPDDAVATYEEILSVAGEDLNALRALDGLYLRQQRWPDLAGIIERELAQLPAVEDLPEAVEGEPDPLADRVELMYRLGQILETHLADHPRAVATYRDILALPNQIGHEGARVALEGLMEREDHRLEIALLLEPVYEALEMWDPLIGVKEIQLSAAQDQAERVALLHAIAALHSSRKEDHAAAFATYARAFREDPSHEDTRGALETIAEGLESWGPLVELYQEKAQEAWGADAELARLLTLKLAELQEVRLGTIEAAVASYRRVLEAFPSDDVTIDALEALYRRTEQWNDLLGIFQKKIELAPDVEARKLLHFQVAEILEATLNDRERAISVYQEVLELDASNTEALQSLYRLYGSLERWGEQAANLERQLELAETDEDRVALLLGLAEVRETRMKDLALAIDTYKAVTDLDPSQADALAALERLIEVPEHRLNISRILEPLYEQRLDIERLVWALEIQLTFAEDQNTRVEYLHRIGRLHEEQSDDARKAFEAYGRALREDPENEPTQENLERLAAQLTDFQALVDLYVQEVQKIQNAQLAVAMHTKIAGFYEDQLGNAEGAIEHYRKVLELDPENLYAIRALKRLYQNGERYRELVEILLREADVLVQVDERKDLFFMAANIQVEILTDAEGAIDVYHRLLAVDPEEVRALDALVELFVKNSRWDDLARTYERKAELINDVDEKKRMLYEMGAVYESELKNFDKAIETYQRVLDLDANDRTAIEALDRLYQSTERWNDLLAVLERERDLADITEEVVALKYRIGRLLETRLEEESQAVGVYADILQTDPTHQETLAALENIARAGTERLAAALVLEPVYDAQSEFERLVGIYEVELGLVSDPLRRLELLNLIANLQENSLQDLPAAFHAYARAVQVEGAPLEVLDEHERLASAVNAWPQVVELYEAVLVSEALAQDPERRRELARRLARVYRDEVNNIPQAIAKWRQILEIDADDREAIDNLDVLYQETQAWPELAEILGKRAQLSDSDEERVENLYRLAQLKEQALSDVEGALGAYRDILDMNPDHAPTIGALELLFDANTARPEIGQILEPYYERTAEWRKLVDLKKELLAFISEKADRIQAMQAISELYENQLAEPHNAFEWYANAFREDPGNEFVGQELDRLARETGAFEALVGVYEERLEHLAESPALAKEIGLRAARAYENDLQDMAKAESAYNRVLQLDPVEAESLTALDRIYLAAQMYPDLANTLRRRIGIADSDDDKIQLYFRLGTVLREELADLDGAVESFRAILALDAQHEGALKSLEGIYSQRQQWTELFGVLEKQTEITLDSDPQAQLFARMADISAYHLSDPERGVELWGRVLDLLGEDGRALAALEALHENASRWEEVVDTLTRQVSVTDDDGARILLHAKLGRLYDEKLSRERNAIESWREVLNIDPISVPALQALAVLYQRTEEHVDLAETLKSLIGIGTSVFSEAEVLELYAQLGTLYSTTLMQPMDAIEAWRSVLEIDGASARALDALESLYRQEAMWEDTIRIIERKGDLAEDQDQKIALYLQASELWGNEVGRPDEAAPIYNKIIELVPGHPVAFQGLEDIYSRNEKWDELIEMLLNRAEQVADQEGVPFLRKAANVFEREKRDPESAFVVLLSAAGKDYKDNETALELERLTGATGKWTELLTHYTNTLGSITDDKPTSVALANKIAKWYGEHLNQIDYSIAYYKYALDRDGGNFEALDALEVIYRRDGKWSELVENLEKRASLTQDPEERKAAFHRLAEVYESQLNEPFKAIRSLTAVLETLPEDIDTMQSLERLYRGQELWEQLIDVLTKRSSVTPDPDEGIAIRTQIGTVHRDCLQDNASAIRAFESILEIDARYLPALRDLQGLYRAVGDWQNLLRILDLQMDVVDSTEERSALFHEKAQVFEDEYRDLKSACECHAQVLEMNPADEHSFGSLERLYRETERWNDLIELYRNHIYAVSDPQVRLSHYKDIGTIYAEQLGDDDAAIESYNSMLDIDRDSTDALDALSRLYEKKEEWDRTMELLQRLVDLLSDQSRRVECYFRMGRISQGPLEDPDGALERYHFATQVDPSYLPALAALRDIYITRQDWENSILTLKQEEANTYEPEAKSALLYHIGYIYHANLEDMPLAQEFYERAMQANPRNIEAAQPLSNIYFTREQWNNAEPLLDLLVEAAQAGQIERDRSYLYHYQLAFTSDKLGNTAKADQFYRSAFELAPNYLPILLGRADLLFRGQDWDQAFRLYQTILSTHRDEQSEEELVEIFYRLGTIKREVKEPRKAIGLYEKGLELQPHHRPTLEALIDMYSESGDFPSVVKYKRDLVETATTTQERFSLFVDLGDMLKQRLDDVPRAIQAYNDALELNPNDRPVLNKVMVLYNESEQWQNAIDIIERIARLEEMAATRAKFYYAAAQLLLGKLKQPDLALEFFNKTLDDDFKNLKAFEKIDQTLTARRDWKNLERNYRKMIKRIPVNEDRELQIMLWHGLGEIYRTRQGNLALAAEAFENALILDPDNQIRHEILAEIYATDPNQWKKAVEHQHKLLEAKPDRVESFQQLYRIYMQSQQYDKAFCLASALRFMGKASPEEQGFYEQYRQRSLVRAKRIIDDEVWRTQIASKQENPYVSAIFGRISPVVAQLYAQDEKLLGLKKKDRVDFASTQLSFPKNFQYVNQILKVSMPLLYIQQQRLGFGYELLSIDKQFYPAVVAGADLLSGKDDKEVVFLIAKNLSYMRPEYFLIRALKMNQATIKVILRAAMVMVNNKIPIPRGEEQAIAQLIQKLSLSIPPALVSQLKAVVDKAVAEGNDVSTTAWMQHAELAANRAGLVLCNDLVVAGRMVQTDPTPLSTLTIKDKIKDLIMYGISEEYFQLRESLGLTITG